MSVVVWQLRQRGRAAEPKSGENQKEDGKGPQEEEKTSLVDDLPEEGRLSYYANNQAIFVLHIGRN